MPVLMIFLLSCGYLNVCLSFFDSRAVVVFACVNAVKNRCGGLMVIILVSQSEDWLSRLLGTLASWSEKLLKQ